MQRGAKYTIFTVGNNIMLEDILKDLDSKNRTVRSAAIAKARTLPPDTLLALILADNKKLRRKQTKVWSAIILLLTVWTIASIYFAPLLVVSRLIGVWMILLLLFPILLLCSLSLRGRQSLASIIADTEDTTLLPHLLSMHVGSGYQVGSGYDGGIDLNQVLLRLLPKVSREQAAALTTSQRKQLHIPLSIMIESARRNSSQSDAYFQAALCVLKSLEQIGDATEYDLVRQLASIKVRTDRDRQIQQAAQECLPFLEICVAKQKQAQTLLRPSAQSTDISSDTLLRPASTGSSETPADQLLRPLQ